MILRLRGEGRGEGRGERERVWKSSKKREIILEQSLNRGACVLVISSREVLISFMGGQKIVYNTQVGVGESIETIGAFYTSEYRYKQFY